MKNNVCSFLQMVIDRHKPGLLSDSKKKKNLVVSTQLGFIILRNFAHVFSLSVSAIVCIKISLVCFALLI